MTTNPTTRADLARMIPDGGLVIELGVAAGEFAAKMLTANPAICYLGIDRWNDHHDIREMLEAADRVRPFQTPHFITSTFAAAAVGMDDSTAALIYIDGYAHTGQEGGETLRDWWPKLKPGGIFAGHDYDDEYPQTMAAVDAFVAEHRLDLYIIEEKPNSSWWLRKPNTPKP